MADLGEYKGRPITGISAILRKTGDGLSTTFNVDPDVALDIEQGFEGVVAFDFRCYKVDYEAEDRKYPALGGLVKVIEMDAVTAVILDADVLADAIDRQKARNRAFEDEQAGRRTIDSAILEAEHADDLHKRYRDDCPLCDAAREKAALEAHEDDETPITDE